MVEKGAELRFFWNGWTGGRCGGNREQRRRGLSCRGFARARSAHVQRLRHRDRVRRKALDLELVERCMDERLDSFVPACAHDSFKREVRCSFEKPSEDWTSRMPRPRVFVQFVQ